MGHPDAGEMLTEYEAMGPLSGALVGPEWPRIRVTEVQGKHFYNPQSRNISVQASPHLWQNLRAPDPSERAQKCGV